jgi:hypothetical protein
MSILSGIFNTSLNPAELNTRSFAGTILRLFPNGSAPLFALTSQAGKSKAKSSTHGYFSKTLTFVKTKINNGAGYLVGDTTFTVDSTTGMLPNMVLHNVRTRENYRITSVASSTSVVVTRAFGRVVAAAINDNDDLIQVGTAFAEGSTRPTAKQLATTYVANYTQIFRNAWGLTDTARASMAEMGYSNIAESRKDCAMYHSIDIESAILYGQPKMDTSGTQPVHATQGIIDALYQYASGNINAAGATTNYDELVALVEEAWTYSTDASNPKSRTGFCDQVAMKVMHQIARKSGQIEMNQKETSFGMQFTEFKFYKGTINLIEHPLMNGIATAATGTMLVLDLPALKLAYMDGRDTVPEEYNVQGAKVENGTDGVGGSFTSELAVEFINPYSSVLVTGLTAGAA